MHADLGYQHQLIRTNVSGRDSDCLGTQECNWIGNCLPPLHCLRRGTLGITGLWLQTQRFVATTPRCRLTVVQVRVHLLGYTVRVPQPYLSWVHTGVNQVVFAPLQPPCFTTDAHPKPSLSTQGIVRFFAPLHSQCPGRLRQLYAVTAPPLYRFRTGCK